MENNATATTTRKQCCHLINNINHAMATSMPQQQQACHGNNNHAAATTTTPQQQQQPCHSGNNNNNGTTTKAGYATTEFTCNFVLHICMIEFSSRYNHCMLAVQSPCLEKCLPALLCILYILSKCSCCNRCIYDVIHI